MGDLIQEQRDIEHKVHEINADKEKTLHDLRRPRRMKRRSSKALQRARRSWKPIGWRSLARLGKSENGMLSTRNCFRNKSLNRRI